MRSCFSALQKLRSLKYLIPSKTSSAKEISPQLMGLMTLGQNEQRSEGSKMNYLIYLHKIYYIVSREGDERQLKSG